MIIQTSIALYWEVLQECLHGFLLFLLEVCTCVVHKRCHGDMVTICPGVKQSSPDDFAAVCYSYLELYKLCY